MIQLVFVSKFYEKTSVVIANWILKKIEKNEFKFLFYLKHLASWYYKS